MIWIDEHEAIRYTQRSKRTLQTWRTQGLIKAVRRNGQLMYDVDSLDRVAGLMVERYEGRGFKAGPGRGYRRPDDEWPTLF